MIDINKLNNYILDPDDPIKNYELALDYYNIKNYSSAGGFFLRAAERSEGDLRYACMVYMAIIIKELGDREFTENVLLKFLNSIYPDRPEAYYHLAKIAERKNSYMDCYWFTKEAIRRAENAVDTYTDLEYPGIHELYFLLGWSAWYTDKPQEARMAYQHLLKNYLDVLDDGQKKYLQKMTLELGMDREYNTIISYDKYNKWYNFIYQFNNKDKIEKNYSQVLQDMFVAYALDGKENGTYLEVGSSFPFYTNNTAMLETCLNWTGIGIDNNEAVVSNYNQTRKNKSIAADALTVDYRKLLNENYSDKNVDYLQLDIQTPEDTYNVLTKIPFDEYKFAVITYEHDDYVDISQEYKERSREYLLSKGYVLAVPDVTPVDGFSFEDWWIHPELVDINRIHTMNRLSHINWGSMNDENKNSIYRKIQEEKVYDYWTKVKDNDVVVDIGANVGAFSVNALSKKLKKLYCIESSSEYISICKNNLFTMNYHDCSIEFICRSIGLDDSKINSLTEDDYAPIMTFKNFINEYKIPYIDFLKVDAEGAEYDIFVPENLGYLKRNVSFISAEFHTCYPGNREKLKYFRDYILPHFDDYKIMSCTKQNIIPEKSIDLSKYITSDEFIDNYNYQIMVYINNDKTKI